MTRSTPPTGGYLPPPDPGYRDGSVKRAAVVNTRDYSAAPAGWRMILVADSRLEGDLVVHMLAVRDLEAALVERRGRGFELYVAPEDEDAARGVLDAAV